MLSTLTRDPGGRPPARWVRPGFRLRATAPCLVLDPRRKEKLSGAKLTCLQGRDATPLGSGRGSAQVRLPCRLATVKLSVVPDASIPPAPGRMGFQKVCFRVERALRNVRSLSLPCLALGEDRVSVGRRVLSLRVRFSSLKLTPPLPPIAERHQSGVSTSAQTLRSRMSSNHRGSNPGTTLQSAKLAKGRGFREL